MTGDSKTPIVDLVLSLLSRGHTPEEAGDIARPIEATMMGAAATFSVREAERRERERLKKKRQRAARRGTVPGTAKLDSISSTSPKTQEQKKKTRKKESTVPAVPGTDGWPADYEAQFWTNFPKHRRYDKPQVMAWLAKARRDKVVEWPVLLSGVLRYAASEPGEYAKAPLPWLRGHRWEGDYKTGGDDAERSRGPVAAARNNSVAAAAARRFGRAGGDGRAPQPTDPVQPPPRGDDDRGGAALRHRHPDATE